MNYDEVIKKSLKNGLTLSKMLDIAQKSDKDTTLLEIAIINEYTNNFVKN